MMITVVGSFVVDLMSRTPHLPVAGETVLGGPFKMGPGGKGGNQAIAAARCGSEVNMITKLGKDTFGDMALASFAGDGINTQYTPIDPEEATGVALIAVDSNTSENMIVVALGACGKLSREDIYAAEEAIKNSALVLTQLETSIEAVVTTVEVAKKHGVPVVLNTAPYQEFPREIRLVGSTAYHLYVWYRDNQFCGRCGHPVLHSQAERALICPDCGNMIFPKIAPAVIIGVTYGDKLLMSRYAGREYKGHALLAGFCEIGETAEETVAREVYEEAKIHVKNIRFYKDQPWGFESDLLLGYYCELDGDPTLTIDEDELAVAKWIARDDINDEAEDMSLTNEMIIYFKEHPEAF